MKITAKMKQEQTERTEQSRFSAPQPLFPPLPPVQFLPAEGSRILQEQAERTEKPKTVNDLFLTQNTLFPAQPLCPLLPPVQFFQVGRVTPCAPSDFQEIRLISRPRT